MSFDNHDPGRGGEDWNIWPTSKPKNPRTGVGTNRVPKPARKQAIRASSTGAGRAKPNQRGRASNPSGKTSAVNLAGASKARKSTSVASKRGKSASKPRGRTTTSRQAITVGRKLALLLLVLAALALGGYLLSSSATKSLEQRQRSLNEVQEVDAVAPIAECRTADLDVRVSGYQQTIGVGTGWSATVTLTNRGADACLADGSAKSLGVVVTSGTYELIDMVKCAPQDDSLPLLLGKGRSWETSVAWDGRDYESCNAGDPAAAGTYVVHVNYLGDKKAEIPVIVQ